MRHSQFALVVISHDIMLPWSVKENVQRSSLAELLAKISVQLSL